MGNIIRAHGMQPIIIEDTIITREVLLNVTDIYSR